MKKNIIKSIGKKFGRFFIGDKGATAILTGLVLVACIGFAALAIDVGFWYSQKRKLQLAADAGAVGGAIALSKTGQPSINAYVTHDVALNGCTAANNCTIVAINNPPTSGPNTTNNNAVEVILSQPTKLYLAGLFLSSAPTITSRAVAKAGESNNCFVTLGANGLTLVGNAILNAANCNIYSNSGISGTGSSTIIAGGVYAVGSINATVHATGGTFPGSPQLPDPYANLKIPAYAGCDHTNYSGTPANITPGVYCGGFFANGIVNMSPGVYIINGGTVDLHGGAVLNGTGVTIILTSSTGVNYPNINDSGGNTLNLSAPTTGPFAGVAFFGDRNAPNGDIKFAGGTTDNVHGALYFPKDDVTFTGNSANLGTSCLKVVASSISINGTASASAGSCGPTSGPLALIE